MLILILIEVQYLHKAVFTFEKGSNCQNHSSSSSCHLAKRSPPVNIPILPLRRGIYTPPVPHHHPLPLFGKPCYLPMAAKTMVI